MKPDYEKHQIYTSSRSHYTEERGGKIVLPDSAKWRVTHHMGGNSFGEGPGPIALILDDPEHCFWPVISFLTEKEARQLRQDLEMAEVAMKAPKNEG